MQRRRALRTTPECAGREDSGQRNGDRNTEARANRFDHCIEALDGGTDLWGLPAPMLGREGNPAAFPEQAPKRDALVLELAIQDRHVSRPVAQPA
jgi:hypothetical protein